MSVGWDKSLRLSYSILTCSGNLCNIGTKFVFVILSYSGTTLDGGYAMSSRTYKSYVAAQDARLPLDCRTGAVQ